MKRQHYYFILHLTRRNLSFLKLLRQLNLIRRFYHITPTQLKVFPTYNLRSPRPRIKPYYRTRSRLVIRLAALRLLHQSLGNSLLVLETHKGVITHKEALQLKIGGVLICQLG